MKIQILALLLSFVSTMTHAFPVSEILASVQKENNAGHECVFVFDLDETLIETSSRKISSYEAALTDGLHTDFSAWPIEAAQAIQAFTFQGKSAMLSLTNTYDSVALFDKLHITTDSSFRSTLFNKMFQIYSSDRFVDKDFPVAGARVFLKKLYQNRVHVYFVSSRFESLQGDASRFSLQENGLSSPDYSQLILRMPGESSLDFKKRALMLIQSQLNQKQEVMLVAENEPENLNAMMDRFPSARPVFIEGASVNATVSLYPRPDMIRARNFLQSNFYPVK